MKTTCLFIFTTMFSRTTAKGFLLTLDTEKGKNLHDNNDIVEQHVEEEKVNNDKDEKEVEIAIGVELKPTTTHTVGNKTSQVHSAASSDYSYFHFPRRPTKRWGKTTVLGSGGTWWECWFKKTRR